MNFAQLTVTILTVKSFDNEDGLQVFSGQAEFSWPTGKEDPGFGVMFFYACGIPGFSPIVGETYLLTGQARVKKTAVEGGGSNTVLNLVVKAVSLPLTTTAPAPTTKATKTTKATPLKASAQPTKQLAAVGAADLDDIPF